MTEKESTTFKLTKKYYVGGYRIGKLESGYTQFNLTKKPNWFHRQIVKWFLGWYWFDV